MPFLSDAVIEYGTDTTRAITSMIYTGAARRYPNIKMIFSHAGGTMPFLIERFDTTDRTGRSRLKSTVPEGFRAVARSFFYDTAQSSNPVAMGALRQVIPVSQIVFGTDFPFRTAAEHVKGLAASQTFSSEELRAIYRHNAVRLLPQFARVSDIASIASGRRRRSVPCRSYPEPEQEQRRQQENDRASKGNPATIEYAKDFAERIANSRVETIRSAGHVP